MSPHEKCHFFLVAVPPYFIGQITGFSDQRELRRLSVPLRQSLLLRRDAKNKPIPLRNE